MIKFLEVIKYEGDNEMLVWKHPAEDFNTSSTLIVHESQEAIFFKNGQAADVFGPGRYKLKTENIPILRRLINIPTGGESPFHCEVYFVNKAENMGMKWGTDSKVQFIEPTYNFPMEIGASGELSLRIADPAAFLPRIVGTEHHLTATSLVRYFRGILMTRVKSYLARTIKEQQLNIFEIDSQLDILSDAVKAKLVRDFAEYGINLQQFLITTVVRPEDDPNYRRVKDLAARRYSDIFEAQTRQQVNLIDQQTASQKIIMESQAIAEKRRMEGYTYQDERGYDVAMAVAENENVGQFTGMGMGLGMMAGVGGALGGAVSGMVGGTMGGMAYTPGAGMVNNIYGGAAGYTPGAAPQPGYPAPGQPMQQAGYPAGGQQPGYPAAEMQQQPAQPQAAAPGERVCSCGAHLPIAAKFCMNCGSQLPPLCPGCGSEIVPGAKFCMNCGQQL